MSSYERREVPPTDEGWYALHDLRRIDWDAWRDATERRRERALAEGIEYLRARENLADADAGASGTFSVFGHEADLMLVHLRPTTGALDAVERGFERTEFAAFTERTDSYLSVTEVSGYVTDELTDGVESVESEGTRAYLRQRLHPSIPEAGHVCFYPMDKRRAPGEGDNWYDLPFETRAELMAGHGEVGRRYADDVTQIITSSVGLDDHEWGVTLFSEDLTRIKDLLYEMRFDPSSSRFAEFGRFRVGRRLPPEDLDAFLAGDPVPTGDPATDDPPADDPPTGDPAADEATADGATPASGGPPTGGDAPHEPVSADRLAGALRDLGVDPDDHPEAGHGVIVTSSADRSAVTEAVEGLRGNFDHYDTHVATTVVDADGGASVVSLWQTERAATVASGFLFDLPGVESGIGGPIDGENGSDRDAAATDGTAPAGVEAAGGDDAVREALSEAGVYAGRPHGENVHAVVVHSTADAGTLDAAATRLRDRFGERDAHARTATYVAGEARSVGEGAVGSAAVVSLWETAEAARAAGEHLADLPGMVDDEDSDEGFGTMGMFYTVASGRRGEFLDRFDAVGDLLAGMDGHRGTDLLVNHENPDDMFIASRWESRADAMAFFRSEEFAETVAWGREALTDRPRHVFLQPV